jgi:predicted MFS family arabinose efflux permease
MNLRLLLLTLCQGLFLTNNVTLIAVNGLVGLSLAPSPWLATLPITAYVAGGALSTGLVSRQQRRLGRQRAFQLGLVVAVVASLLAAAAVHAQSFWGLVLATLVAGYYSANAGLYRFAALELVPPAAKETAISWVLAGGIIGGVIGPNLAQLTRDWAVTPFLGVYLTLAALALVSLAIMSFIAFPAIEQPPAGHNERTRRQILSEPRFLIAVLACALGYGVMNLLMAATPIAMQQCGLPFSSAAFVLEWHVLAMFVPSFFTGSLIKRIGVAPVLAMGVALNAVCVVVALSGIDLMHFTGALIALGLGWNFLYIGGTTLATSAYRPEEKTQAQATMDFCVFVMMTLTSFSSGALVTTGGWTAMNLGSLLPIALMGAAVVWLTRLQKTPTPSPA